jgi:predicted esterase
VLALAGGALGGGVALYQRAHRPVSDVPVAVATDSTGGRDDPPADWCAPGFEPLRGGACFASAGANREAPLIVYLHGRYARDAANDEIDRQRRLGARATALGYAVLALRGRLHTCTAPELADWYCWPSNETNADAGPEFIDGWAAALAAAQERIHAGHRFLLGFSNGGYFAGLIASRGLLDVDAVVVAHGGPVEPVHALRSALPLLLLSADDDVAQDEMIRFDEELTREHWAHDSYARAGGHGLTDVDIDAALTFFARASESLPLSPPLALHRAIRHVRDAGAEDASSTNDAQEESGGASLDEAAGSGEAEPADPTVTD